MAAHAVLWCLDPFPADANPFDALVDESHFRYAFPGHADPTATVLFTAGQPQHGSRARLLLCAHLTAERQGPGPGPGDGDGDGDNPVCLLVSRLFLRHRDLRHRAAGSVRLFSPSALSKVVVGARSRHSFKWASSDRFAGGLRALASEGHTLLAREGDELLLPYQPLFGDGRPQVQQLLLDLVVLSCSPVRQGRITPGSCVVVSDLSEPPPARCGSPAKPPPRTRLFVSDFAHFSDSLSRSSSLLASRRALGAGFPGLLLALEGRVDVRVADVFPLLQDARLRGRDVDSAVFVSRGLLMKLGLFNHEWVVLSELRPSQPRGGRLASLLALDLDPTPPGAELHLNDAFGLISTAHWFNLSGGEAVPAAGRTLRIKRLNESSVLQASPSFCRSASPRFASELHVEPVRSPQYDAHRSYDSILAHHFATARLVSPGDVLAVSAENCTGELDSISHQRCVVLYFKVKKVLGSGDGEQDETGVYLADKLHTSLYTGGATSSLVPFCSMGSSLWSSFSPAGLTGTVDHITSIILPHLNHRSSAALGRCNLLLQGARGCGKMTSVRAACRRLHLQLLEVQCVSVCGDTAAACEVKMRTVFQKAESLQPCVLLLRNLQYLGPAREGADEDSRVQAALCHLLTSCCTRVVVIATVSRHQEVSADVMAAFVHQVTIESPNENQRAAMLASLSQGLPLGRDVSLEYLAKYTSGFVLGDLSSLLAEAGRTTAARLLRSCVGQWEVDLCSSGVKIQLQDFTSALKTLQDMQAQAVGAPKIPSVRWQDVGGLQEVKQEILNTVQLPLQRPELLSLGLHRVGLLLYGPPGTGKTLLAKAVATECSMTFLSVKGPELINMFVGQSEENIREVFSRARSAAPCVVFFDELDSLAPSRGRSADSGGVMDRVVSQLLAELDALHSSKGVFVIGATNRPDLLDQALLRPGRFDKLVYVGINSDRESQLQVLKAITAKFHLDPGVNLEVVVEGCPSQLSGADIYALCSEAMTAAIRRKTWLITDGLDTEDSPLLLSSEDFTIALKNLQSSVSDQELLKYQHIQQKLTAK
ncbi:Peroxisome assembly factor 2 [Merluccius polli]|uniref:Peroxisomal ATPase PEX6 n=1 Tax=Merluccius polli TaxID=89951 RepID=A0AA47NQA0_MERPO|nr:Peroxisome assembly factor 2 [Merluccius polli]